MRALLVSLAGLAASGCFNPDDIFPVEGDVSSIDGVQGLTVELWRSPPASQVNGTTCVDAVPFKTTVTDERGHYRFDVFRAQAQGLSRRSLNCFVVRVAFPSGAAARVDVPALNGHSTMPLLRDWRSHLGLDAGVARFDSPVPVPADDDDSGVSLDHVLRFVTTDGGMAWKKGDRFPKLDLGGGTERLPITLGPRELEDFEGALELEANLYEPPPEPVTGPVNLFDSNSFPVVLTAAERVAITPGAPADSRGLACPSIATPCPLTDGALAPVDLELRQSLTFERDGGPFSALVFRELELATPLFGVQWFGADGGLLGQQQAILTPSVLDTFVLSPRKSTDGGFDFSALPAQWAVVSVDAGTENVSRVVLRFSSGVRSCAEVSLVP